MMRRATLFLSLLALAGCSGATGNDDIRTELVNRFTGKVEPRAQSLYKAGAPQMQVGIPKTGKNGTLILETRRDGIETWLSGDGATLILDHGMLRGTRGFGVGLLASDVAQSSALVHGRRKGRASRFHTFLTGTDKAVTRSYVCRIESRGARTVDLSSGTVPARLMAETCRNPEQEFTNLYWVADGDGRIVQSRQWMGDYLGHVSLRVVESSPSQGG